MSDVAGNSTPNTYTLTIPACALNCNTNQLPEAVAHDVTVIAANVGGMAQASIENGSYDPEGDSLTISQTPPGPYPVGVNSIILTVADSDGAADQATATVTVLNPGFTLARTQASVSATAGGSAMQQITFTPAPGIAVPLTLACRNLPEKWACSFSPATLPSGSGQTQVAVTISATTMAWLPLRSFYGGWLPFTGLGLLGITVMGWRKKAAAVAVSLLCVAALAALLGCGGGGRITYPGTAQRTYTITVAGTSGNLTKTTSFNLTAN